MIRNYIEPRAAVLSASLRENLRSETDSVAVTVTGSSKIFIKGNNFLIANLTESLVLAFVLITLSMAFLFANVRMIVISLLPNLLALMITAGLMGYFGIPLKASTALIFSITFGISVDNSSGSWSYALRRSRAGCCRSCETIRFLSGRLCQKGQRIGRKSAMNECCEYRRTATYLRTICFDILMRNASGRSLTRLQNNISNRTLVL